MADQTKYTTKLHNKRILIIGASSGLGYGVAEGVLEHGAKIAIASSNPTRIASAASSLAASYPSKSSNIHSFTVDLANHSTIEANLAKLFDDVVAAIGGADKKLDHVVYTAGDSLALTKIADLNIEAVLKAGSLRFFAPLLLAKFIPTCVVASPLSSYTITSGGVGEKPAPDWSIVASYCGGHHAMVRNLAVDLKPVRVNGVAPGAVDTELWNLGEEEKKKMFEVLGAKLLTGRVGRVEDVVESYLGILRDANMDGTMVRTDGGHTIV
ncbi:short chain dehydrogenase [Periconia macrospinosa]|uniref:Short chain dehydrogenase n=1 Tax=Periconia macrospinosa TaxID=97972 RepID=A0A2V1DHC8_9PLEO|nr:short chain dehydrogenase [Periconia macrospinosa]